MKPYYMYWQTNPLFIITCAVCTISILLTILGINAVGVSFLALDGGGILLFMAGFVLVLIIMYVKADQEERFGKHTDGESYNTNQTNGKEASK